MSDDKALINLSDLSKPATVLIEKVSDAVGAVFRPYQIKRMAKAEAEVDKIKLLSNIELGELEQRAMERLVQEEARKQKNIESITLKAAESLNDKAEPEKLDDDWLANFFDKCRLVSDQEMQSLWANILAGQANSPAQFSRRTVELVSTLEKEDANLFTRLNGFSWHIGNVCPLIFDIADDIYKEAGIDFNGLSHLDSIGLITFNSLSGYVRQRLPKTVTIGYYGTPLTIEFEKDQDNDLQLGHVLLTRAGQELAPICGSTPKDGFLDYTLAQWKKHSYIFSTPSPHTYTKK